MATNPWDAFPAVQGGDQIIAPPDPYKQANETRAQQDQVLQIRGDARSAAADARAADAAARAAENDRRSQLEWQATHNPDGTLKLSAGKPTEAQQKIATLLTRISGGFQDIKATTANDSSAQAPGYLESLRGDLTTGGLAGAPLRAIAGQDRRIVHDAQRDVLDALLTLGTGAAYNAEQLTGQMAAYFPSYGDSEREIEVKNARLQRLIEAAKVQAGPQWNEVEAAIQPFMPKVQGADGGTYDPVNGLEVTVTDDRDPSAVTNADPGTIPPTNPPGGGYLDALAQGAGSVVEGIASIPALVVDPLSTTIGRALGYSDYTSDFARTVREDLGLPANQDSTANTIIRGGTSALTGAGLARAGASVASGVAQNALNAFGATPLRDTASGAGAAFGGEVGRQVGGVPGQVIGTLAGGLGGYQAGNAVARQAVGERVPNALLQAGQRQNVDLLPAEVGGPAARAVTTGTRASPLSVAPVVRESQRQADQLGSAASRVARGQGDIVTSDVAGDAVRGAAERFTKQTSARGRQLYDRAGQAAKGVRIKPNQTVQKIDEYLSRVAENPAASQGDIQQLQSFRDNIANGVSVQGLRDARTALSQGVYNGQLRSGSDQAMWKDILGNLSDDIDVGLRSVGKEGAANLFRRADGFWKDRVEHIDQVLQPILGRDRSGEQIVESIEGMARGKSGGSARLSRLLANMTEEEAGNVRATVIDRMGKANPGAQSAEGDVFSPATFLTNWNKMTPQAKASLFSNKSLRADLNDIAALADGKKVGQSMTNYSNTGVAIGANASLGTGLLVTHPIVAITGAGAQYVTGRLMASPAFARALASTKRLPADAANRKLSEQLTNIVAREPALSADARGLQQYLSDAMRQSPTARAMAGENEQDNRREPVR